MHAATAHRPDSSRHDISRGCTAAVLLVLAGYHGLPRGGPVGIPESGAVTAAAASDRVTSPRYGQPQAPLDESVVTPMETVGASGRE